ncbi:hypothetical protein EVAR_52701_1 [Eumeta japonica]|uniref:Uncharacterized protein n=1 Tax=Eumeta variegata TaxID=151549 RepID=A0A4C1Y4G2_EUMVA|nr:hypothetical protein EVAR_52701_1 [Eumeta japonica]
MDYLRQERAKKSWSKGKQAPQTIVRPGHYLKNSEYIKTGENLRVKVDPALHGERTPDERERHPHPEGAITNCVFVFLEKNTRHRCREARAPPALGQILTYRSLPEGQQGAESGPRAPGLGFPGRYRSARHQ